MRDHCTFSFALLFFFSCLRMVSGEGLCSSLVLPMLECYENYELFATMTIQERGNRETFLKIVKFVSTFKKQTVNSEIIYLHAQCFYTYHLTLNMRTGDNMNERSGRESTISWASLLSSLRPSSRQNPDIMLACCSLKERVLLIGAGCLGIWINSRAFKLSCKKHYRGDVIRESDLAMKAF